MRRNASRTAMSSDLTLFDSHDRVGDIAVGFALEPDFQADASERSIGSSTGKPWPALAKSFRWRARRRATERCGSPSHGHRAAQRDSFQSMATTRSSRASGA